MAASVMMRTSRVLILLVSAVILSCAQEASLEGREEWMSVTIGEQKVGWVYVVQRPADPGYELVERARLELSVMGQARSIETLTRSENSRDHQVRTFQFELLSGEHSYKVEGEVVDGRLATEIFTGGEKRTERLEVPDGCYLPQAVGKVARRASLRPGRSMTLPVYDPSVLALHDASLQAEEAENLGIPGFEGELMLLKVILSGVTTRLWIDRDGWTVKEMGPMGVEMIRTDRETAMKRESGETLLEILTHYSVPSDEKIPNARDVSTMTVELRSEEELPDLEDERQEVLSLDPLRLKISTQSRDGGESTPDDLASTPLIQCDDELIEKKALAIVDGANLDSEKVERLVRWLFVNIEKTPTVSFPSALDVLKSGEGDCNEHAVLFAALARSLGIPTRVCVGIVYQNGFFFYHAWNKVWLERWVACDATFGQPVADATHIKLLEGDLLAQLEIARIIGNIEIDILEHHP